MKNEKKILGRGLASLLPENKEDEAKEGFAFLDVNKIKPNPFQPRTNIPIATIMELSESIKEKGVMNPITVIKDKEKEGNYILVAGERRLQAAKLAGADKVPAVIKDLDDRDMAEMSIIENIHRRDLSPIEEGYAFLRLCNEFKLSEEDIANKISKSRSYVDSKLTLTKLPQLIQNAIAVGEISEYHGRALYGLSDEEAMIAALKIVIRNNLSVKRTEELVREIKSESVEKRRAIARNPTMEWEQKFGYIKTDINEKLGWDVKLKKGKGKNAGGSLVINFGDEDELVSIYRKISGNEDSK